jgi:two-component system response regulator YesN
MSGIPSMFERCLQRGGYLFFADKMPVPVIDLHEKVFAARGDADRLGDLRQKLFDGVRKRFRANGSWPGTQ